MSTSPTGSRHISRTSTASGTWRRSTSSPTTATLKSSLRGGYGPDLIGATEQYIRALQRCRTDTGLRDASLRELIGESLRAGTLTYFAPYEAVHRANVETVLANA